MKKVILSEEEQSAIAQAVKKAESRTSGEISTAVIAESSDYAFFEVRAAVVFAVLLYILQLQIFHGLEAFVSSLVWNSPAWLVPLFMGAVSLIGGGLFYFFSNLPAVDRVIIPKNIMAKRVRARALMHFTESGVYQTKDGTGILIFISLLEKRVEILADEGISSKMPEGEWESIVSEMTASFGDKKISEGLIGAIERCGRRLEEFFPKPEGNENELSDNIVILEE
ncbi:MAG: TPM domain-containing protein [Spirochaetales bacterium]|nr:TPM domain-containing protein [Spirochaetales bacterium]